MKLFGQLVRTVVNTVTLPIPILKDAITMGGAFDNNGKPHTLEHLEKLKREAQEDTEE